MIITEQPSVNTGMFKSVQLMYDNAIAVFGIVPMFGLAWIYNNDGDKRRMQFCINALMRFKRDKKFVERVSKNQNVINGNSIVMLNDVNVFDVTLRELGYYETYNQLKLESEIKELINFLDIGIL